MSRSYSQLVSQAVVNFEFFREDMTSRGTGPVITLAPTVGTARVVKVEDRAGVYLEQSTLLPGGGFDPIFDVTSTFTIEVAFRVVLPGTAGGNVAYFLQHYGATGGFYCWVGSNPGNEVVSLYLRDAAGATARRVITPAGLFLPGTSGLRHAILTSRTGGTDGACWWEGSPQVPTLVGAGTAAASPAATIASQTTAGTSVILERIRGWVGEPTNDEAQELYRGFRSFVRPSMV